MGGFNGNHEIALSAVERQKLEQGLRKTGILILKGSEIRLNQNIISLYGVDDPLSDWDNDADTAGNMEHTLNQLHINKNKYNILLSHRPEAFNAYSDFDLVLSGHAHGGQFRILLIGGIIAPGQGFFPKYDAGEYKKGRTTMIVSREIGNSIIPVRINNRPELIVINIS